VEVQELSFAGVRRIRPKVFCDHRGFFRETFHQLFYRQVGITEGFVQDNHSFSKKGTVRGMHFQRFPGQAKLVTVIEGEIFDVVVDIRPSSPTFGKWEGVYLNASQGDQLFVPIGFAHGFCVVGEHAHVFYKVSAVYDPAEERGFRYDDPFVGIAWPVEKPVLSERDLACPSLKEAVQ
jgi:dTDP-4-dehydrorhamnose 3,5-epimerase